MRQTPIEEEKWKLGGATIEASPNFMDTLYGKHRLHLEP